MATLSLLAMLRDLVDASPTDHVIVLMKQRVGGGQDGTLGASAALGLGSVPRLDNADPVGCWVFGHQRASFHVQPSCRGGSVVR